MRLGIFHTALDDILGGAELLAVEQARICQELGAEVRIRTVVYDAARWGARVGTIPVDALHQRAPGRAAPRCPHRVRTPEMAWAEEGLSAFDAVTAHNFPTNAVLGLAP